MPGKSLSSSSCKERPRKSNSESQPLGSPLATIAKKMRKNIAKENESGISSSEDRTDERKVLIPKKLNICDGVKEGMEYSRALSTSMGHCGILKSGKIKISKKFKKTKPSSATKKSTCVGGYDADISFAPDSSPEAKRKTKNLRVEKSSADSIPVNGDAPLTRESDEEPGDTLSDHGDTDSKGDCSDDCEEKCQKNDRKPSYGDNLRNGVFDDDEVDGHGEQEEDESEVNSLAREMIDNEAIEADSSEDEDLDESNEGYGIYFESGSTIKGSQAPPMDVSYNSAKEQEEMEADDEFVVSDTLIEYVEEDDSWLDDDVPETKRKKYSRIVPSLGDDSSSEDEREWAKLTDRHDDNVVELEEASQTGSDSGEGTTADDQNNRAEKYFDPPSVNKIELTPGKESLKVCKRGTGERTLNTAASEVSKAPAGNGSDQKSRPSASKKRVGGDTRVIRCASLAPEQARRPLTIVQKLTLLTRCSKDDLLNLAKELVRSERQFFIKV